MKGRYGQKGSWDAERDIPNLLDAVNLRKIEFWATKYEFSFQFWGEGNNNVFINKDDVEIHSSGGYETVADMFKYVIAWCEKANPKVWYPRNVSPSNFQP